MPSLIKSEPADPASPLSDDAVGSLVKALMTLKPGLIQSVLSAGKVPDGNIEPRSNLSPPVSSQTPVAMVTTTPTKNFPAMRAPLSTSNSVLIPTPIIAHSRPGNTVSSHYPHISTPTLHTQTAQTSQIISSTANLPPCSTPALSTSLPQLVPVSSEFSSLVAAPASTSVMNSGSPTSLYSDLRTSTSNQISSISDILNSNSLVTTNVSFPYININLNSSDCLRLISFKEILEMYLPLSSFVLFPLQSCNRI